MKWKRLAVISAVILCAAIVALVIVEEKEAAESRPVLAADGALLTPRPMPENRVIPNPYMSSGEALVHNDIYSSDVTQKAAPLGIYAELNEARETQGVQAPPAFFYDDYGNCITVLNGGAAIRIMDEDVIETVGTFMPLRDDPNPEKPGVMPYVLQISYSFVDNRGNLVVPTNHGHLLMLQTTDEKGDPLEIFRKKLDADVVSVAREKLGDDINDDLMSVIFDYGGNLWFITGGFRMDPAMSPDGVVGYLDRAYIDAVLRGEKTTDLGEHVTCMRLSAGENVENGISAHPEGVAVATNKNCMLLRAGDGKVETVWSRAYESAGLKVGPEGSPVTGSGLSWGCGTTPTLTNELVIFTDNQETVNIFALDIKTGEIVAQMPVLENLKLPVAVDNSILAYSPDEEHTTVLVSNWCGAGKARIDDSSVQTYDSIYDKNWIATGKDGLLPGMERIDFIRKADGTYKAEKVWTREDLTDTAMVKLSTPTGYFYTYTQDPETGMWQFMVLDYDTGETVYIYPVSAEPVYNNMAVGMMLGNNGNTLYCPTNHMVLLRLQDRLAYLPEEPQKELNLNTMGRELLTPEDFRTETGTDLQPLTYLTSAQIEECDSPVTLAFRVNGLTGKGKELVLFARDTAGALAEVEDWQLTDQEGREVKGKLSPDTVYEIRLEVTEGSASDLNAADEIISSEVILAYK